MLPGRCGLDGAPVYRTLRAATARASTAKATAFARATTRPRAPTTERLPATRAVAPKRKRPNSTTEFTFKRKQKSARRLAKSVKKRLRSEFSCPPFGADYFYLLNLWNNHSIFFSWGGGGGGVGGFRSATPNAFPPSRTSIFSYYSFHVHRPSNRDDRHLLAQAYLSIIYVYQKPCQYLTSYI
jgi:hypothetical protein